ncbi:MAG TPA: bifunctional 2-polyprenyl-6-hydroxyphenol methylase/3-demethylubiquinol 3-O-methyltransferase UbiG [Steroidobacteraceae bacterium]|nr:bifunctional 2-polyprenyl-6-hydroxyphenol methylase/3-demethylubiquinol 3-O-methyltransferase UbiG [Steroidobacteraceae bacterium]
MHAPPNVDAGEIAKFEALAQRWWDPAGEFRPLHELNPLRLGFIMEHAELRNASALDVGCGGGILSEAMAREGAKVLGIDLAQAALQVAELHAVEHGVKLEYRLAAPEELAASSPGHFDIVTCMEMLEHVPAPDQALTALATLLRPDGHLFISTINRNLKAFLLAIVGAEYVLRLLPRGTHDYARFIRPSELAGWARHAGLELVDIAGIEYHPITRQFFRSDDATVNYLVHLTRAGA